MTSGGQGPHEQGAAHGFAAAADEALALPLAGLPGPGRTAGEGCDLAAAERSELRRFADQSAGDDRADAGDGGEQIFDDPPSAADEIGEKLSGRVGKRARLGLRGLSEASDHRRVDRVGLGPLAERLR